MGIMENLVRNAHRETRIVECTHLGGVMAPLAKINNYDVYIYGAGRSAAPLVLYLEYLGLDVLGAFDKDPEKQDSRILGRVSVHSPDAIRDNIRNPENALVIVSIANPQPEACFEIYRVFYDANVHRIYNISDGDRKQIEAPWTANLDYYLHHLSELDTVYDLLLDEESRETFQEYIKVYINGGIYRKKPCDSRMKYFFGNDKNGGEAEKIYVHFDDEVWLNCGSNIGDTIFQFFSLGLKAKKIYAFEGEKNAYEALKQNLKLLPRECRDTVSPINVYVDAESGFQKLIADQITLVNADIEGAELQMLHTMMSMIIRDRPVLSICIYHKAEDLVSIPIFLSEHLDSYVYVLRKYESVIGDAHRVWELVLYAVPCERCLL